MGGAYSRGPKALRAKRVPSLLAALSLAILILLEKAKEGEEEGTILRAQSLELADAFRVEEREDKHAWIYKRSW